MNGLRPAVHGSALIVLLLTLLGGCTGTPEGVEAVDGFVLDRYLGRWYEIARLDHRFERGLTAVTATYSLRDDGGVRVVNRGYDTAAERWEAAVGKAYFIGEPDVGRLKVSFFGPFYGGYNIIELRDNDDRDEYGYSLVAGPDRSYLWILARSPSADPAIVESLVETARRLDFPTEELIFVEHRDGN